MTTDICPPFFLGSADRPDALEKERLDTILLDPPLCKRVPVDIRLFGESSFPCWSGSQLLKGVGLSALTLITLQPLSLLAPSEKT